MADWTFPSISRDRRYVEMGSQAAPQHIGFVVQLISLTCIASSSICGDLIGLKFNGQPIWGSGKLRMHPHAAHKHQVKQFDFTSRKSSATTATPVNSAAPNALHFDHLSANARVELWEYRRLMGSKRLGAVPVSAHEVGLGDITVVFAKGAARYALTYRIIRLE